jgi:hypothetical protein
MVCLSVTNRVRATHQKQLVGFHPQKATTFIDRIVCLSVRLSVRQSQNLFELLKRYLCNFNQTL